MQAWAGCLSHLIGLPGLSVSDPKTFLVVFIGMYFLVYFTKSKEISAKN